MQQSYAGKDIVKFIAAILWLVMGIIYLTYVFDSFDAMGDLKPYKQYGGSYYKQAMEFYWIMAARLITTIYFVTDTSKYLNDAKMEPLDIEFA